jgi:threonine dehydratase
MSQVVHGEGLVGLKEIEAAARRLVGIAVPTPLIHSDFLSEAVDAQVRLKFESLQRAGSFKIRGAYNFISQLSDDQVSRGIITYSSGNHGQAVALAAKLRGIRAVVVMPTTTPKVKRDGAERFGAELVFEGTTSVERRARAEEIAKRERLVIVPPFDHRHIIAGAGTVGLEIAREWPDVDFVLVPVGGGGLLSGVAASVRRLHPKAKIVGVEPVGAASMRLALDNGSPALLGHVETIADGLAPSIVSQLTFDHARELVDDVVTVTDDAIRHVTSSIIERHKAVVEFSGATAAAALTSGRLDPHGGRVAVVISGGNLDPLFLRQLL